VTPATGTALLLLAAFVLPGFVTLMVKERTYEAPSQASSFDRLLGTLYYSALVYVVPAVVVVIGGWEVPTLQGFVEGDKGLRGPVATALGVVLGLPLLIAYLGHRWTLSQRRQDALGALRVNPAHATATAWDFMFGEEAEQCLIRATLKDGTIVSGYYGPSSHSGFGASTPDLFLEQRWVADEDDTALAPVTNNFGIWLRADEIICLELYAYAHEQESRITAARVARHR